MSLSGRSVQQAVERWWARFYGTQFRASSDQARVDPEPFERGARFAYELNSDRGSR
jgi:hypothetical protein